MIVELSGPELDTTFIANKVIDWSVFLDSPCLFWPLPKDLDHFKAVTEIDKSLYRSRMAFPKEKEYFCKPRAFVYADSAEYTNIKLDIAKQGKLPLMVNRLYSGEIQFVCRFKILEIAHLASLFHHYMCESYYNGYHTPSHVTHHPFKSREEKEEKRIGTAFKQLSKNSESSLFPKNHLYEEGLS